METSTVPVAWNWFGRERDLGAIFFSNSVKEPARHPKLVAEIDSLTWANLVLPLSRHDFSVGTGDFDTCIHAGLVMRLNNVSAEDATSSNTTIVWTLSAWETVSWPAVWPALGAK